MLVAIGVGEAGRLVGLGVAVGIAVGGWGVSVAVAVLVAVAVGGSGVAVGGSDVAVAVAVGGSAVAVAAAARATPWGVADGSAVAVGFGGGAAHPTTDANSATASNREATLAPIPPLLIIVTSPQPPGVPNGEGTAEYSIRRPRPTITAATRLARQ